MWCAAGSLLLSIKICKFVVHSRSGCRLTIETSERDKTRETKPPVQQCYVPRTVQTAWRTFVLLWYSCVLSLSSRLHSRPIIRRQFGYRLRNHTGRRLPDRALLKWLSLLTSEFLLGYSENWLWNRLLCFVCCWIADWERHSNIRENEKKKYFKWECSMGLDEEEHFSCIIFSVLISVAGSLAYSISVLNLIYVNLGPTT